MADLSGFNNSATKQLTAQLRLKGGVDIETISADASVVASSGNFLRINGGTSNRNIDLLAEASASGLPLWIVNSGTSNNLVVRDDTPTTIATLRPGEFALIACDGSSWVVINQGFDAAPEQVVSFVYGEAVAIDACFFVAARAYRVVAVTVRPLVVGSDGGAVTLAVKKAPSGTAIASGTAVHSGSADLKGTINTNQALTLSTTSADLDIASGDAIGIDCTGTMTAARGVVSVALIPA